MIYLRSNNNSNKYLSTLNSVFNNINYKLNNGVLNKNVANYQELKDIITGQLCRLYYIEKDEQGILKLADNYNSFILDGNINNTYDRRVLIFKNDCKEFYYLYHDNDKEKVTINKYVIKKNCTIDKVTLKGNLIKNNEFLSNEISSPDDLILKLNINTKTDNIVRKKIKNPKK